MRSVVLVSGLAALLAAGACTRSTRTVVLGPNPDVREAETSRGPSTAATLGVPPGHLPDEGECRVWIPGAPPGTLLHQGGDEGECRVWIPGAPPGRQPRPKSRPCP